MFLCTGLRACNSLFYLMTPRGGRGDAANDATMCANLYAATFNVTWTDWAEGR